VCAAALSTLFAACGGSLAKPGQDAAVDMPIDTPPPFDLTVNEPAGDVGELPDAGSCQLPITQDGTCNSVALVGPTITSTCSTDPAPVARGGVVEDGTYVLDSATTYGNCAAGAGQQRITWVICGNAWETVQEVQSVSGNPDAGLITERIGLSVTPQQTSVMGSIGCWNVPGTGPSAVTWDYDATPGHLSLYIKLNPGVRVDSFTKR